MWRHICQLRRLSCQLWFLWYSCRLGVIGISVIIVDDLKIMYVNLNPRSDCKSSIIILAIHKKSVISLNYQIGLQLKIVIVARKFEELIRHKWSGILVRKTYIQVLTTLGVIALEWCNFEEFVFEIKHIQVFYEFVLKCMADLGGVLDAI